MDFFGKMKEKLTSWLILNVSLSRLNAAFFCDREKTWELCYHSSYFEVCVRSSIKSISMKPQTEGLSLCSQNIELLLVSQRINRKYVTISLILCKKKMANRNSTRILPRCSKIALLKLSVGGSIKNS